MLAIQRRMDSTDLNRLAFLALGGLLSVLWPVVTDAIRRGRENILAKQAMRAELAELGVKLTFAAHLIDMRQGTVSKQTLQWLKTHLEQYAGIERIETVIESTRLQLSWSDEELEAYVRGKASSRENIVLQKYGVPMLDSRISALWSLENRLQHQMLTIRTEVDLLNDLVDRSRHYSDLTFTKLEAENYKRVVGNVEQIYGEYAKRARRLVEQVAETRSLM